MKDEHGILGALSICYLGSESLKFQVNFCHAAGISSKHVAHATHVG
jgi:hypothetical protein